MIGYISVVSKAASVNYFFGIISKTPIIPSFCSPQRSATAFSVAEKLYEFKSMNLYYQSWCLILAVSSATAETCKEFLKILLTRLTIYCKVIDFNSSPWSLSFTYMFCFPKPSWASITVRSYRFILTYEDSYLRLCMYMYLFCVCSVFMLCTCFDVFVWCCLGNWMCWARLAFWLVSFCLCCLSPFGNSIVFVVVHYELSSSVRHADECVNSHSDVIEEGTRTTDSPSHYFLKVPKSW